MKEKLYKKELFLTVLFFVVLLIFGHFAQIFVLFPGLQGGSMWGFPVHYIMPIVMGWFGLLVVTIVMAVVLNKFDDDMEALADTFEGKGSNKNK
ncbi:MAG: hypothetical protein R6T92_05065 [Desulfosalsimonadaceae bacterium]